MGLGLGEKREMNRADWNRGKKEKSQPFLNKIELNCRRYKKISSVITDVPAIFKNLAEALQCIPNIRVKSHGNNMIFFNTINQSDDGLFFITRSIDERYNKYPWRLTVSASDRMTSEGYPNVYCLEPQSKPSIELQASNLIKVMNEHVNHKKFMESYKLDLKFFNVREVRDEKK